MKWLQGVTEAVTRQAVHDGLRSLALILRIWGPQKASYRAGMGMGLRLHTLGNRKKEGVKGRLRQLDPECRRGTADVGLTLPSKSITDKTGWLVGNDRQGRERD